MECVRLRVKDLDFEQNQVIVRDGKGQIDRITMLPEHLKPFLQSHLKRVKIIHEQDLKKGGMGVKSPLDMLQIM
jgi:integrase